MKDSQSLKKKPKKFKNINKSSQEAVKKQDKKNQSAVNFKNKKEKKTKIPFNKDLIANILLIITPLFLIIVFMVVFFKSSDVTNELRNKELNNIYFDIKISPFPLINNYTVPEISAQSAIIIDADSLYELYSKNPNLRFSMASTTKIMTALAGMDFFQEKSVLTIHTPVVEGSNIGFDRGEKYYFKDLLYAMMLPSSNEAAYAIAENYPGGREAFMNTMNEKVQKLGLINTHFSDPAGLDDDNNYTTVTDLSKLGAEVFKNKLLTDVVATKQYTISNITSTKKLKIENLNKLLGMNGISGIKTGTTEGAGEVLVLSKQENGHTYIIIVMKSKQRYADVNVLLSMISNNIRYINPEYTLRK